MQLAVFDNPRVTYAVMDMVLGEDPVDPLARVTAGNNLLYAANGFSFNRSEATTPYNWTAPEGDMWPEGITGKITPTPDVFSYDVRARKRVFKAIKYVEVLACGVFVDEVVSNTGKKSRSSRTLLIDCCCYGTCGCNRALPPSMGTAAAQKPAD